TRAVVEWRSCNRFDLQHRHTIVSVYDEVESASFDLRAQWVAFVARIVRQRLTDLVNGFGSKNSPERLAENRFGFDAAPIAHAFADLRHAQLWFGQSEQDPMRLYRARNVDGLTTAIAQVHHKVLMFFRQTLAPCRRIQRSRVAKVSRALVMAR